MAEPREFFIEERLEKYRLEAECNLGESGIRNVTMGELLHSLDLDGRELEKISLADAPNQGGYELRRAIADLYDNISPEEVLVTTGTGEALYLFFHLVKNSPKGDSNPVEGGHACLLRANLLWPAFQALYEIPATLGFDIRKVNALDGLSPDKLFEGSPDLVIVNHPHNPTGRGLDADRQTQLKKIVPGFDGYVLFDEHYRFLDYKNDLTFSGAGLSPKTFATGSVTKCFGITGLRIGWLVGDPQFLGRARSFKDYLTHTVNPVSEFLALQVFRNRKKLIAPVKKRILNNIKYFQERVADIASVAEFTPPEGGVVAFPKLRDGIKSEDYCDRLYQNCSVFALPGSNFETEGYIRIAFGETEERFCSGVDRWVEWERG